MGFYDVSDINTILSSIYLSLITMSTGWFNRFIGASNRQLDWHKFWSALSGFTVHSKQVFRVKVYLSTQYRFPVRHQLLSSFIFCLFFLELTQRKTWWHFRQINKGMTSGICSKILMLESITRFSSWTKFMFRYVVRKFCSNGFLILSKVIFLCTYVYK